MPELSVEKMLDDHKADEKNKDDGKKNYSY